MTMIAASPERLGSTPVNTDDAKSLLFTPVTLRDTTVRNRAWVAPMCQFSAEDGVPTDWHLVHLGSFAVGGAGLVLTEATAVSPIGRISASDTGLWNEEQEQAWARITKFVRAQGAVPAVQLAHAGRKASVRVSWEGGGAVPPSEGGWQTVGPTADPWGPFPAPHPLSRGEIAEIVEQFGEAARRAVRAGFGAVEIHAAHGYLIHSFLSPLSNDRLDEYGGDLHGRSRILREVIDSVRSSIPDGMPLLVRISATDWVEGGWSGPDTVELARLLTGTGVDLIDVSSGGQSPEQRIRVRPGYQMPFARQIKEQTGMPVGGVGLVTEAAQAEQLLVDGACDVVLLGRQHIRDPHWALRAAKELGVQEEIAWPRQYHKAQFRGNIP